MENIFVTSILRGASLWTARGERHKKAQAELDLLSKEFHARMKNAEKLEESEMRKECAEAFHPNLKGWVRVTLGLHEAFLYDTLGPFIK